MGKTESGNVCRRMGEYMGGSITLFLALVLMLVFSLVFCLLEAARVRALDEIAARSLLLGLESAFGEYQPNLWEEYGLLFLDGGNNAGKLDLRLLEGHMLEEADLEQKGSGFYQMALRNLEVTGYTLATDDSGAAFRRQACAAIQAQLTAGAMELIRGKAQKGSEMAQESKELETQWESAKGAMAEAEKIEKDMSLPEESGNSKNSAVSSASEEEKKAGGSAGLGKISKEESGDFQADLPENPVDSVDLLKHSLTLDLAVENPAQISGKAIVSSDMLAKRNREQGNLKLPGGADMDKLWLLQYLDFYFSCGSGAGKKGSAEHALEYELEYCIAGKDSDYENLEKTVKELLVIREAGNFATIMQDGKKQALALEIATAAVGFTGLAPLIKAVQIGILLAWSYIESILDVRCLLSGGRVALIKAVTDWKSDVTLGQKVLSEKTEKTESRKDGLDYREYLQILLLLVPEQTLAFRAMDVIENNMRCKIPSFRMDCQIHGVRTEGLYTSSPLFTPFVIVSKAGDGIYHFREHCSFAYLD